MENQANSALERAQEAALQIYKDLIPDDFAGVVNVVCEQITLGVDIFNCQLELIHYLTPIAI